MDWLKRDGRSLGEPFKNRWCGDFVETCIRMGLPDEPLLGALGTNPYWARHSLGRFVDLLLTWDLCMQKPRGEAGRRAF
jgi:hypothetical protein